MERQRLHARGRNVNLHLTLHPKSGSSEKFRQSNLSEVGKRLMAKPFVKSTPPGWRWSVRRRCRFLRATQSRMLDVEACDKAFANGSGEPASCRSASRLGP
jgi:hypothetical protein